MMKSIISTILIVLLIMVGFGCIGNQKEKNISDSSDNISVPKKNIEKIKDISPEETPIKELVSREDLGDKWYKYSYKGPVDIENSERARMSIIPYLEEKLGWTGGIDVVEMRSNLSPNVSNSHYIVITLPFTLSNESVDYFNKTLANYNFDPLEINVTVE